MPRKGENIYQRKDGRWEGKYIKKRSSTGAAIYGSVYAPTYTEVRKIRSQSRPSCTSVQQALIESIYSLQNAKKARKIRVFRAFTMPGISERSVSVCSDLAKFDTFYMG